MRTDPGEERSRAIGTAKGETRKIRNESHFNSIQPRGRVIDQSLRKTERGKMLGLAWNGTHSKSLRHRSGQVETKDTA